MSYQIKASSIANQDAVINIKESNIDFGTTSSSMDSLPNPAELFLGSFAACILKNVERFSVMMKFTYTVATIEVTASRIENPPRMENIIYNLTIHSKENRLNTDLLKKNIEKFGTIYNTLNSCCSITGEINSIKNV